MCLQSACHSQAFVRASQPLALLATSQTGTATAMPRDGCVCRNKDADVTRMALLAAIVPLLAPYLVGLDHFRCIAQGAFQVSPHTETNLCMNMSTPGMNSIRQVCEHPIAETRLRGVSTVNAPLSARPDTRERPRWMVEARASAR